MNNVSLLVYPGDTIHPDAITKYLNITPTTVNIPGQILPPNKLGRRRKITVAGWFLESEELASPLGLHYKLDCLLQQLLPVKTKLRELQKLNGLKMMLSLSIWVERQGESFSFSSDQLRLMSQLKLEFGFDIYMWDLVE